MSELAGHGNKAMQRHLGGLARAHLGFLIIPAQRAAAQRVATERAAATRAAAHRAAAHRAAAHRAAVGGTASDVGSPGTRVPVRLAALAAWLLTAGSGGVLLANWLASGRRRRAAGSPGRFRGSAGPSRGMVFSHFGLAIGGLGIWIGYLLTRWAPVAWIALAILLPVAGLGMATLIQAIPDPDPATGGDPVRHPPALPYAAVRTRKMPVVMIAAHGALATATLLLALLGSVAALGSR